MSKIIVTGGAGFIGSHLVDRLIEKGHSVIIIDDFSTGKAENVNPKAEVLKWDISEMYFNYQNKDLDYLFHLAAIPRVPYSIEHPTKTHNANITGTFNMLKAAKDSGCKKFIFASSSSVYGDQELPLVETKQTRPKSPYAFHKLVGEQYCRLFDDVYNLPTVCLRFFNVYGPRCDPNSEYSLVIGKFKKMKAEGKPFTIYGDGEQSRDFTYVDDIVDGLIKAMESGARNEVINLCGGHNITINKIAELIGGEKIYLPARSGDVLHTKGDPSKAKKLLNWEVKVPIEEGIKLF
jgi:UDP-glucose 4-epimerase